MLTFYYIMVYLPPSSTDVRYTTTLYNWTLPGASLASVLSTLAFGQYATSIYHTFCAFVQGDKKKVNAGWHQDIIIESSCRFPIY